MWNRFSFGLKWINGMRADYWKSQTRHFCDFCKCWTADNKPSREFHEKGKRHQENVKKKLDDLRKKGLADAKLEKETSSYLQQMERAALMKLKADLAENPTMASQYGVTIKRKETEVEKVEPKTEEIVDEGDWCEATTPEGYTYYWNTVTKESRWELPESFNQENQESSADLSEKTCGSPLAKKKKVADAEKLEENESSDENELPKNCESPHDTGTSLPEEISPKASSSPVDNEESVSSTLAVTDIPLPMTEIPLLKDVEVPKPRLARPTIGSAYGQWQQVQPDADDQYVDLQLPVEVGKVEQTIIISNEPKMKFREKQVTSLSGSNGPPVGFRKVKAGVQRRLRTTDNSEES